MSKPAASAGRALIAPSPVRMIRPGIQPAQGELDELVREARSGSEAAFAELFRLLQPRVLRYLHGRHAVSPEDVASEAWICVARDVGGFRGGFDAFCAWVFTIVRARAVDAHRRESRHLSAPIEQPPPDCQPSAEQEALDAIASASILSLVRSLPPDQADAVATRVLFGLDVATAAEVLGKTPTAIRINTHRGLRRLAALLVETSGAVA